MSASRARRFQKGWKVLLFGGLVVLTGVALFYAVTGFLGRRDWDATKRELLAKGEPLSLSEMVPPEITDEENFFATGSWKALAAREDQRLSKGGPASGEAIGDPFKELKAYLGAGKNLIKVGLAYGPHKRLTDLSGFAGASTNQVLGSEDQRRAAAEKTLRNLERAGSGLQELVDASDRQRARFPLKYDMLLPHISVAMTAARALQVRAVAHMETGNSRAAANDILVILRLAESVKMEPTVISWLTQMHCALTAETAFWECTVRGHWSDEELQEMQAGFAHAVNREGLIRALQGERGMFNEWLSRRPSTSEQAGMFSDKWPRVPKNILAVAFKAYPHGWLLMDQADYNRSIQEMIDGVRNNDYAAIQRINETFAPSTGSPKWSRLFSKTMRSGVYGLGSRYVDAVSRLQLAVTACALERYRLRHDSFPITLADLVPAYLSTVPNDPVTQKEIGYSTDRMNDYTLSCTAMKERQNIRLNDGFWSWSRNIPTTAIP